MSNISELLKRHKYDSLYALTAKEGVSGVSIPKLELQAVLR
jgi:hypothetical protein